MGESPIWVRVGGACGVAFAILLLISAFAGGPPPGLSASGKEVAAYYAGGGARVAYIAGAALPSLFAPWFLTTLTLRLWTRTSDRAYATVGLVAIAIAGATATAGNVIAWGPLVYGQLDEDTARTFDVALQTLHGGVSSIIFTGLVAFGIVQVRMPGLWRWVGYLAFLAALLELINVLASVGNGSSGIVGLFGFLGFILWAGLTGALQIWRASEAALTS